MTNAYNAKSQKLLRGSSDWKQSREIVSSDTYYQNIATACTTPRCALWWHQMWHFYLTGDLKQTISNQRSYYNWIRAKIFMFIQQIKSGKIQMWTLRRGCIDENVVFLLELSIKTDVELSKWLFFALSMSTHWILAHVRGRKFVHSLPLHLY